MLSIVTWHWGAKYGSEYVRKLKAAVARNLAQPYRFIVATPDEKDVWLTKTPGCLVRLRMFDPVWQQRHDIKIGDRVACVDLDVVVTGGLDPVFDRDDEFCILQGVNASNPCPYNGSIWMLKAGARQDVWFDFSIENVSRVPYDKFPDDQAWFAAKIPNAGAWGPADGVYAFQKPGWPKGENIPVNARVVAFPGWRDPSKFTHLGWVRENWQ